MNELPAAWAVVPHVDVRPASCGCGQDVELVTGSHCPRCGTHLHVVGRASAA